MAGKSNVQERIFLIICILIFSSLIYSVYFLSVSLLLFGLTSIVKVENNPMRIGFRSNLQTKVSEYLQKPEWWLVSLPFFLVLFGGFYSDDSDHWLERLRIKLPFLLFPIAFYLIPSISRRTYFKVHFLFIIIVALSSLPISWYVISHYSSVIEDLSHGRPVKTPISHIRYSLLVAMAACSSFWFMFEKGVKKRELWWLKTGGIYLTLFLHVLAVRSGLVAFYLVAIYVVLTYFNHQRRLMSAISLMVGILLIPVLAYRFVPSFQKRINYTIEDVGKYQQMQWNSYSDAERLLSLRAGLSIARRNIWFGTGTGDLRNEMKDYFYKNYDKDTFIMPHNQFISILAGSGVVGLTLFLLAILAPVFCCKKNKSRLFMIFNIIVWSSMMVENTLETSVGVAFYLFFLLLGLNHLKGAPPTEASNS